MLMTTAIVVMMMWMMMFLMMMCHQGVLFSVGVLRSVSVQVWLTADAVQATRLVRSLPSACREQILVCGLCSRPRLRKRCG